MHKSKVVNLYVWSGDAHAARELALLHYPNCEIREFPHRRLRESGFLERIRLLRGFRGQTLVFYFQSVGDLRFRQILEWAHFLHRCRQTVFCDSGGVWEPMRSRQILRSAPAVALRILLDGTTLAFWWLYLRLGFVGAKPSLGKPRAADGEVAYLIPSLATMGSSGGAISHIRGFLCGLKHAQKSCRVFTGTPLAQEIFENEIVANSRPYFFWEAAMLAYNWVFARQVQKRLAGGAPEVFYQRHCRFAIAGALLSQRMNVPLVLEYNGPQGWMADHWDPTPFRSLLVLCEEVTLRCAARIIVVSRALEAELLQRGIALDRIRVNPNGVDATFFYPGRGRQRGRVELNVQPDEVLVGFVGSFSLWHGIAVLQQAIVMLLSHPQPCRLRFVLVGDGLLHGEMRSALAAYEASGGVIFTGPLPPDKVADYLDASDILVSPHIPTPDGSRFFGSPTKLFEYMAMGKSIVASRLEQIAEVLEHDRTGWLVTPGNVEELAGAIVSLALDSAKREALGATARQAAVERHTWAGNVEYALNNMPALRAELIPVAEGFPRVTGNSG